MKSQNTPVEINTGVIRAGVISLAVFSVCYIGIAGGISERSVWWFIVSFAVGFVLMMQAIVDLFVLAFTFTAKYSGKGVGRTVRLVRRIAHRTFSPAASAA